VQRSTRSISAFLQAGDAYFKAVPRIFAAEPAITEGLARLHPGLVPEVLAVDVDRRWLLTRDFGDEKLMDRPATLDHGDRHADNVVLRDGKPLIFDWSDACLAQPLVSVRPMLAWDDMPVRTRRRLRDAYLVRLGAPAAACDDAMLLGLAHQAVSYHRITGGIAPHARWEWETVLPWIVKQLLDR
jgi:hypothetical protein